MSTTELAANSWSREGSTRTGLDVWASIRAFSPQEEISTPPVEDQETGPELEPAPYDPDRRSLSGDVWRTWFSVWR